MNLHLLRSAEATGVTEGRLEPSRIGQMNNKEKGHEILPEANLTKHRKGKSKKNSKNF